MIQSAENENTVCVVLSGGKSSRMKAHKALLRFSENQNFLQHIIDVYQKAGIHNIVVVKNSNIDLADLDIDLAHVSVADNYYPDRGRLYSLQLGLKQSPGSAYCYIQNIDNPFVTTDLIENIRSSANAADVVTPEFNRMGGHPVLVSSPVINAILALKDYNYTLRDLLRPYNRYRLITDNENCILNINLPSDYRKIMLNNKIQPFP